RSHPCSPPFPYTTLFRSAEPGAALEVDQAAGELLRTPGRISLCRSRHDRRGHGRHHRQGENHMQPCWCLHRFLLDAKLDRWLRPTIQSPWSATCGPTPIRPRQTLNTLMTIDLQTADRTA